MLRDVSSASIHPYSFSRVQLSWWTLIVLSSFISILITKQNIPTFNPSTLILLGISSGTTAIATLIDLSDRSNTSLQLSQNEKGQNFFLDILSDKNGINIHRFQAVVFNIVFGIWFIKEVLAKLPNSKEINYIIPLISNNNLILLGLSSGTYAALKSTENKQPGSSNQNMISGTGDSQNTEPAVG